ncbi:hypothetical protein GCM10027440_20930 [Nocardiopsis coralliicola]
MRPAAGVWFTVTRQPDQPTAGRRRKHTPPRDTDTAPPGPSIPAPGIREMVVHEECLQHSIGAPGGRCSSSLTRLAGVSLCASRIGTSPLSRDLHRKRLGTAHGGTLANRMLAEKTQVERVKVEQETTGPRRTEAASQKRTARMRQWFRRAAGSDGHERHTLLLIGKSGLAATIAWSIAYYLMNATSPAFAPFTAVLMMQVTVYQSVAQSLRYVAAVSAGVAVQGVLGFIAGPDLITFALVALVALIIGRWPALGSQGSQVVTAAFFAFSLYVASTSMVDRFTQLGQIILLVLIGCAVGTLVNLLVFPPMRYRSAEHGVRTLAHSLCDLLGDMYPALHEADLDSERTEHWRSRATRMESAVTQARSAMRTAEESVYYNPRRLFRRNRSGPGFSGYGALIDALERAWYQVASATRSFDTWNEDNPSTRRRDFLHQYGDFLASLGEITRLLSEIDENRLEKQAKDLCSAAETAKSAHQDLCAHAEENSLPLADHSRPYGILMAEANRLMDDFQYTCDVLQQGVNDDAARRRSGSAS